MSCFLLIASCVNVNTRPSMQFDLPKLTCKRVAARAPSLVSSKMKEEYCTPLLRSSQERE